MTPDQVVLLYLCIALATATVLFVKLDAIADMLARIAEEGDQVVQECEEDGDDGAAARIRGYNAGTRQSAETIRLGAASPARPVLCVFAGMLWPVLAALMILVAPMAWKHRAR